MMFTKRLREGVRRGENTCSSEAGCGLTSQWASDTLLAPAGSGGEALIRHWAELVQRSQAQATRWRVLLDGVPILDVHEE
jgi:hypothetical protein